jgi:hypothetical protein
MKRTHSLLVSIAWCLIGSLAAHAHHSGSEYASTTVEIAGTLLEVAWQNPHVHFFVRAKDEKGNLVTWDIEANSLSILRRTDATPENLKVGDTVKVAGAPSRRAPNRMWAMNILAANGREIVLGPGAPTRWTTNAVGMKSTWAEGGTAANKTAGIFRVWSTKFGEGPGLWRRDYPLTDAAKKARASCTPENAARSLEGHVGRRHAGCHDRPDRLAVLRSERDSPGPLVIHRRALHANA